MPVQMISRAIPGPEKDWLTEADVLALLDVSSRTLDTYISEGRFPKPVKWGRDGKWKWEDVAWFYLTKQISDRFSGTPIAMPEEDDEPAPTRKRPSERKPDATVAQ